MRQSQRTTERPASRYDCKATYGARFHRKRFPQPVRLKYPLVCQCYKRRLVLLETIRGVRTSFCTFLKLKPTRNSQLDTLWILRRDNTET